MSYHVSHGKRRYILSSPFYKKLLTYAHNRVIVIMGISRIIVRAENCSKRVRVMRVKHDEVKVQGGTVLITAPLTP